MYNLGRSVLLSALIVPPLALSAEAELPQTSIKKINEDFLDNYQINLSCSRGVAYPQVDLFASGKNIYMLRDSNSSVGYSVAELKESKSGEYYHSGGMRFFSSNLANTNDFYISAETLKKGEGELTVVLYRDIYKCDAKLDTWAVSAAEDAVNVAVEKIRLEAEEKARAEAKRINVEAALSSEERNNDVLNEIRSYIRMRLQLAWRIPSTARNGMSAVVAINLFPSGEIDQAYIDTSSGDEAYDRSALQAAYRVGKFENVADLNPILFERRMRRILVTFRPDGVKW